MILKLLRRRGAIKTPRYEYRGWSIEVKHWGETEYLIAYAKHPDHKFVLNSRIRGGWRAERDAMRAIKTEIDIQERFFGGSA